MLLDIDNISYTIQWENLLQDISFSVKSNQVISIIGYNGSWKSTLLKLLLWSLQPSQGKITRKPWVTIWYVPQKLSFTHQLPITANDFITIYNWKSQKEYDFSCSLLDIKNLLDKPLHWLSGWQLQRVLIYNALLWKPNILLLDEPTAWLDIVVQKEFYTLLEHIHQAHDISIVLVSHDIHTVYSKSDTIICLHEGLYCSWSPNDTVFSKEVTDLFGWYMAPYLHSHTHKHDG